MQQNSGGRVSNEEIGNIWFPFTPTEDLQNYKPLKIARGKGVWLYDSAGNRYLDGTSSWWTSLLGHCHPEITRAVQKQAEELEHVIMAGAVSPVTLEVSRRLAALVPDPLNRVFFTDNGSTAVEVALKIALQHFAQLGEKRTEFIALGGGYHGDTLGAVAIGSIEDYHGVFHRTFKKCHATLDPDCFRCPLKLKPESCEGACMQSLETLLEQREGRVAAVIFEPMVQGAAGFRMYPPSVLHKIDSLCKRYGVLSIADEVFTGFGRTGKLFACQHAPIVPDILCLAKGLTGGFLPLAATVVSEEMYAHFTGRKNTLYHGHSFTGSPMASSAAAATLRIISEQNVPYCFADTMSYFQKQCQSLQQCPGVAQVRTLGMIAALELAQGDGTAFDPARRLGFNICQYAVTRGLFIRPLGDVLYLLPPLIIEPEEIDFMVATTREAISRYVTAA